MTYIRSLTHLQTAELYCTVKDGGFVQAYGRAQPPTLGARASKLTFIFSLSQ